MAAVTTFPIVSPGHFTVSVPPWFDALHVRVHTTSQTEPCWHVRLLPSPIVTEQLLALSHVTLADAPAVSVHVAPAAHSRFELSAAVMVQVLPEAHCASHEAPHAPVQDAPAAQESLQPCVALWHCPVEARLHVVWLGQLQTAPEHAGGVSAPPSEEPPSAGGAPRLLGEAPLQANMWSTESPIAYLVMTD
jgi:hypothetical protein